MTMLVIILVVSVVVSAWVLGPLARDVYSDYQSNEQYWPKNESDTLFQHSSFDEISNNLHDGMMQTNNYALEDELYDVNSNTSFEVNPATGLPMMDGIGSIDVGGSPFGMDIHDSFSSMDSGISSFDDSFGGINDSFSGFDDW